MRLITSLACVAVCLCAVPAQAAPDFTGTWQLENASHPELVQRTGSQLIAAQNQKELSVARIGASLPAQTFALDGSPAEQEAVNRQAIVGNRQATLETQLAAVDAHSARLEMTMAGNFLGVPARRNLDETWSLSPDGQTLTVHTRQAGQDATLTYRRATDLAAR